MIEKLYDADREKKLIASLVTYPDYLYLLKQIKVDFFSDIDCIALISTIKDMDKQSKYISYQSLLDSLKMKNNAGVQSIIDRYPSFFNSVTEDIEAEIKYIRDLYERRVIQREIVQKTLDMMNQGKSMEEIKSSISSHLTKIETDIYSKDIKVVNEDLYQSIINPKEEDYGLLTGISAFDKLIMGIRPDQLITIGGVSGSGKTAIIIDIIYRLLTRYRDIAICFFSYEMSEKRVLKRLYSRDTGFNNYQLHPNSVKLMGEEELRMLEGAKQLVDSWSDRFEVFYDSFTAQRVKQIGEKFIRKHKGKLCIFILDHIGELASLDPDRSTALTIETMSVMKDLCKMGHTAIPLTQLKKELEDATKENIAKYYEPNEQHIMGSTLVKAKSDIVILLQRPYAYINRSSHQHFSSYSWEDKEGIKTINTENLVILRVVKDRDGETANLKLNCDISINYFSDFDNSKIQTISKY